MIKIILIDFYVIILRFHTDTDIKNNLRKSRSSFHNLTIPLNMKGIILKCVNYETPIIPSKQLEEFAIDL